MTNIRYLQLTEMTGTTFSRYFRSILALGLSASILLPVLSQTGKSQIYPVQTDFEKIGVTGPVRQVVDVARSWSPELERWNPLVQTTVWTYTEEGLLRRKHVTLQNRPVDRKLFVYDSITGKPEPISEVSPEGGDESTDASPLSESIFMFDEKMRRKVVIERDFRRDLTTVTQYVYDTKGRVKFLVTTDSADGYIRRIEEFYWTSENRPTGSTIRLFDPETDPFRSLEDTTDVPEERIGRDYTSYGYEDTTHPVIWLAWELGNDTVVDRQELRRFDEDNNLFSSLVQRYEGGAVVGMQARIYNPLGDVLSAADSFGKEETFERAFDYIYDARDEHGNWRTKRQYVALDPTESSTSDRVLLSRVDRTIVYF